MIIYEVNISIQPSIADEYTAWLEEHIVEMLRFEGFRSCQVYEIEHSEETLDLCVQYQIVERKHLEYYFKEHADSMRNDGIQRFGTRFSASRRIMSLRNSSAQLP